MNFSGKAKRLDDIDLPRIGARIGVGEDELHAFMDVEASGSGFDKAGRPKMLFEPHIFYRELKGKQRDKAVAQGLAYPKQGTKPYPRDSYPRLKRAMTINNIAALRSASWGLGQILGRNHSAAGYTAVTAMVHAFEEDEENHLNAIVNFLISKEIEDDLREHRWSVVARVYNGPAYAKHNYHGRMAEAFAKWSAIADTPWPVKPETKPSKGDTAMFGTITKVLGNFFTGASGGGWFMRILGALGLGAGVGAGDAVTGAVDTVAGAIGTVGSSLSGQPWWMILILVFVWMRSENWSGILSLLNGKNPD